MVIPILKNNDEEIIENYRPIYLLSVFSKILEKMQLRFEDFLKKYNLLNSSQHRFRENLSTLSATFAFFDDVYQSFDETKLMLGLFFHLIRAFDCVYKNQVIDKLFSYCFRDNINKFIESFLTNRAIIVNINETKSLSRRKELPVTQRAVLAPLLFIIFINDL